MPVVGQQEAAIVAGDLHQHHLADDAVGAQSSPPREDRLQQRGCGDLALHQQLGAAGAYLRDGCGCRVVGID